MVLTDVTSKALSPGVNDPTTAIDAIGRTSALLCELARHPLGDVALRNDDGIARVHLHRADLADMLENTLAEPRHYAAADPIVLTRIFTLLREVAWALPAGTSPTVVSDQLDRLRAVVDRQGFGAPERRRLDDLAAVVDDALAGRWTFGRPVSPADRDRS